MGKKRVIVKKFHSDVLQAPEHSDAQAQASRKSRASKRSKQQAEEDDIIDDNDQNDQEQQLHNEHDGALADDEPSDDDDTAAPDAGPSSSKRQRLLEMLPNNINEAALKQLAAGMMGGKLMNQRAELSSKYQQQYASWRFQLRQGFSLLFYGTGSKRRLLEHFASSSLTDGGVLAVAGYQAGTTARHVLAAALHALTSRTLRSGGCQELLEALAAEPPGRRLYVLVHNIDGHGLRGPEELRWLAALAALPHISLLASVDHWSAGLLWDKAAAARCCWAWHHTPTFAPYAAETLDSPFILAGAYQQNTKRGACSVLLSLVTSAREVFRVLAQHQLEDPDTEGATFQHLYRMCRERFLVSSEAALRQHLTEFKDHDLVRQRPGAAGEMLAVPMEAAVLKDVLAQMDAGV